LTSYAKVIHPPTSFSVLTVSPQRILAKKLIIYYIHNLFEKEGVSITKPIFLDDFIIRNAQKH
jgi:hypothetical protein